MAAPFNEIACVEHASHHPSASKLILVVVILVLAASLAVSGMPPLVLYLAVGNASVFSMSIARQQRQGIHLPRSTGRVA
jgi:uncharacterized membrane protein YoaK (UPF0700 family)